MNNPSDLPPSTAPREESEIPVAPLSAPPAASLIPAPARVAKLPLLAAAAHGLFFLVTGLWPIVRLDTFESITGPKKDHALVITEGWLLAVIGTVLLVAAVRRRVGLEMFVLGIGTGLALLILDVVFVIKGAIPFVYLLDAVAEMLLLALWIFAAKSLRARAATKPLIV